MAADLPGLWRSATTTGGDRAIAHRACGVDATRPGATDRGGDPLAWRVGDATRDPPGPADVHHAVGVGETSGADAGVAWRRSDGGRDRDSAQQRGVSRGSRDRVHRCSRAPVAGEVRSDRRPARRTRRE